MILSELRTSESRTYAIMSIGITLTTSTANHPRMYVVLMRRKSLTHRPVSSSWGGRQGVRNGGGARRGRRGDPRTWNHRRKDRYMSKMKTTSMRRLMKKRGLSD